MLLQVGLRKNLFKFFDQYNLKITIEANVKFKDFLDISMNLETGIHRPFRKEDSIPTYINVNSNHPPHIIKNLPNMISKRISKLSSNEEVFNQEANLYNEGLRQAGYTEKIKYIHDVQPNRMMHWQQIWVEDSLSLLINVLKIHGWPSYLIETL